MSPMLKGYLLSLMALKEICYSTTNLNDQQ